MRQAILTKFVGPTNHHGGRVRATAEAGSITVSWDHALGAEENHAIAAKALAQRFGWHGCYVGGGTKTGYVFVRIEFSTDFSV